MQSRSTRTACSWSGEVAFQRIWRLLGVTYLAESLMLPSVDERKTGTTEQEFRKI